MKLFNTFLLSVALVIAQATCLNFSFPKFYPENITSLNTSNSDIALGAIQVTYDLSNPLQVMNTAGRSFYKHPFTIWRRVKGSKKNITASFNATFTLNISPFPTNEYPIGEGLAFAVTGDPSLPNNSEGEWLGIVNSTEAAAAGGGGIVAVEFDTRKSFPEDMDDNHVGVNLNSIYSAEQVSLTGHGINISAGEDMTVRIQYDGTNISVFVSLSNGSTDTAAGIGPVLTVPLDVSEHLPGSVFVGFTASTGAGTFERNCVKSWEFSSESIDEEAHSKYKDLKWVLVSLLPAVAVLAGVTWWWLYWSRRCRLRGEEDVEAGYTGVEQEILGSSTAPKKFRLRELRRATGGFNPKNQLGKGGFGTVYKGVLEGGLEVAVKRVSKNSRQGKDEFVSEVKAIAGLSHRNLVRLVGWCYESRELLIVYEFMPNKSLDGFIFAEEGKSALSWERRRAVAVGVAQALDYLHNGSDKRVLHRDVKASNIMLDSEFNPRLGDFGLARMVERSQKSHHSTTALAGTPGYMAPESFFTGQATVATDVYGFGVLLLEVVTGRKPANDGSISNGLVSWAWRLHEEGRAAEAADPRLEGGFEEDELASFVALGLGCCHPNPDERPTTKAILKVLAGEDAPPALPREIPAFVWPSMPPSFKNDGGGDTTLQGGQITPFTEIIGR